MYMDINAPATILPMENPVFMDGGPITTQLHSMDGGAVKKNKAKKSSNTKKKSVKKNKGKASKKIYIQKEIQKKS
jgi:hypothetical protein